MRVSDLVCFSGVAGAGSRMTIFSTVGGSEKSKADFCTDGFFVEGCGFFSVRGALSCCLSACLGSVRVSRLHFMFERSVVCAFWAASALDIPNLKRQVRSAALPPSLLKTFAGFGATSSSMTSSCASAEHTIFSFGAMRRSDQSFGAASFLISRSSTSPGFGPMTVLISISSLESLMASELFSRDSSSVSSELITIGLIVTVRFVDALAVEAGGLVCPGFFCEFLCDSLTGVASVRRPCS